MEDYSKHKWLIDRLKSDRITESQLVELLSLWEKKGDPVLSAEEMKKLWELHLTVPMDAEMRKQVQELKELASTETDTERDSSRVITWKQSKFRWIGMVAASIAVVLLLFFANGIFDGEIEYHTGFGEREKIVLPDGSVVELNANTSLTWDKTWRKNNIRQVTLEGEAFFEVRHTEDNKKFVVMTNDLYVEVLGTSFNISNRHKKTEVYLKEGRVRLDLKGNKPQEVTMVPGQKITYSLDNKLILEVKEQNPKEVISWKNNVLYFENESVDEILMEVSDLYGVRFEYSDQEIRDRKLNFWVPYSDWKTTKEAFELTMNLKIQEIDGVYVVGKK